MGPASGGGPSINGKAEALGSDGTWDRRAWGRKGHGQVYLGLGGTRDRCAWGQEGHRDMGQACLGLGGTQGHGTGVPGVGRVSLPPH